MMEVACNLLRPKKPRSISEGNMKLFDLICRRLNNVSPKGPDILTIRDIVQVLLLNLKLSRFFVKSGPKELDQRKINRSRGDLRRKLSISECLHLYLNFVPLGSPFLKCRCPFRIDACIC